VSNIDSDIISMKYLLLTDDLNIFVFLYFVCLFWDWTI